MNLREHTIEEVWNSEHMRRTRLQMLNDEIPESCRKCFAEESKGISSLIFLVNCKLVLTSLGRISDFAGLIKTSSNARDFLILEGSISEK